MINSKYSNVIFAIVLSGAIVCTVLLTAFASGGQTSSSSSSPAYAAELFAKDSVISVSVSVDPDDWSNMLQNASSEQYIPCDVTINGTTFQQVGIRPKGNSSLSSVERSGSSRYSFKLEFDHYIKGQTCFGLDKLVLNNVQSDSSYMKEIISYDLMSFMDVTSPLYGYADITVNGGNWGLYVALEAEEDSFLQRMYGSDSGNLYSVKSKIAGGGANAQNNGGGQGNGQFGGNGNLPGGMPNGGIQDNQTNGSLPNNNRSFGGGQGGGASGGSLVYTDDNASSYSAIFDNAVTDSGQQDYSRVIQALKALSEGKNLESYFDVDQILRYFAVHTFVVNLDSYVSNMQQNYSLYEKDGKVTVIPWDYNLAFGGFQSSSASAAINFPVDTPVSGVSMSARPLLDQLLKVDEYKQRYHEYLQKIVTGYVDSGRYAETIDRLGALCGPYVKNDATAFVTYDQYSAAVPMLKEFIRLRGQSVAGQLAGTVPSTTEGQSAQPDKLVSAGSLNLSVLGSQGGMGGGNNGDNNGGNTFGGGNASGGRSGNAPGGHANPFSGGRTSDNSGNVTGLSFQISSVASSNGTDGQSGATPGSGSGNAQGGQNGTSPFSQGGNFPWSGGGSGQNGDQGGTFPGGSNGNQNGTFPFSQGGNDGAGQSSAENNASTAAQKSGVSGEKWLETGMSAVALAAGILFVWKFPRRKSRR